VRKYLYNAMHGLHDLLAIVGLGYPQATFLAQDEVTMQLLAYPPHTWKIGRNVLKSQVSDDAFPSKCLPVASTDFWLTFNDPPTATEPGFETPRTLPYLTSVYPRFFVNDDLNNPLSNGDVKTKPAAFPFRKDASGSPVQFGNAVANAVDLFRHLDAELPDWNLDGDRGLAYATWQFKGASYNPDAVEIEPES
jgi:hypothetical protein